jgi:AraC family transcriptional regulator
MRLGPGEYFGRTVWERRSDGLLLTLSVYVPKRTQPWHCHANPTFFMLLGGDHRDHSRHGSFDQPAFSLVYHPTTNPHAGELGTRGVRGLNIEYEPGWLERHGLREADLGGYRPFDSARARIAALRLLATAFQNGSQAETDLETQALELLAPLVSQFASLGAQAGTPPWLDRAKDFLEARFRESVSLRDVAQEVGVHPVYLARVFRGRHGCSVSEYLRALRLVEAGRLVLDGSGLAQAACAAGFSDQPHFSRSFSRELGLTPKTLWPVRLSLPP